ncbi:MAG: fluoride efflux transporter CrcB [Hyphomicrobiales bacterium]|nr:fluoride efflux transporter CrcB [Hyphomicrobiales bacterium]
MKAVLLVFAGAGLGGVLRHLTNLACLRWFGAGFPWGTLAVNVGGSLVMGLLAAWLGSRAGASWSQDMRLLLMTGVLGGFTTFSAFSLDAFALWERGAVLHAGGYVLASVVLSIAALGAGLGLGRALT